jgi:phenylpyruvate tautomerase PptA (4-oxalocrotonate tautomerase family)
MQQPEEPMPTAKIHIHEGRYSDERLAKLGDAIQAALENVLKIPKEDYYRIFHLLPPQRFVHTLGFLGMTYTEDFILLEIIFIVGWPKETRLALLKELNDRVVEAVGISPDDLSVLIYEVSGENISFGQGLAQRAHISAGVPGN